MSASNTWMKDISIKGLFSVLMLLILPLSLCGTALVIKNANGPYYLRTNSDPEYAFLLMSLNIAQGKDNPGYLHPGTTLILLDGIFLKINNLLLPHGNIKMDVLKRPEHYLDKLNSVLIALNSVTLFLLGLLTYFATRKMSFSLLVQLSPFLSTSSMLSMARVSLEPLLLFASLFFVLVLVVSLRFANNQRIMLIPFAVISGFALATKVTFAPLLVIPFFFFSCWAYRAYFILGVLMSFELFTLPLMKNYEQIYKWLGDIITHKGHYGEGALGLINISTFLQDARNLIREEKIFAYVFLGTICFIIVSLGFSKLRNVLLNNLHFKLLIGISLAQLFGILITLKHYAPRYILPSSALTGVALLFIFMCVSALNKEIKFNLKIVIFLFAIIVSFSIRVQVDKVQAVVSNNSKNRDIAFSLVHKSENEYEDSIKILAYGSSSLQYALHFGNSWWSNQNFSKELESIYGTQYYFLTGGPDIIDWSFKPIIFDKDIYPYYKKVILQVDSSIFVPLSEWGLEKVDIMNTKPETIYELRKK